MLNNAFTILSVFYGILLAVVYFSKIRINTIENRIYSKVVKIALVLCFFSLGTYFFMKNMDTFPILNQVFARGYLLLILIFTSLISYYVFVISINDNNKNYNYKGLKWSKIFVLVYSIIVGLLICFLPIDCHNANNIVYSSGVAVDLTFKATRLYALVWIIILLIRIKRIKEKKYWPMIFYIILGALIGFIQSGHPEYLLATSMVVFVTFLMYFTIENPDMKMLNEMTKNNELVEQTYIDKSNFLFEMTQEIREPLFNIRNISLDIQKETNIDKIKIELKSLNNSLRQLDFVVNDVLNVNTLDVNKVKFVNNRYNLNSLYEDLIARIKPTIKKDVEFRHSIPNSVPYLYGDYIKLKQVLYSLLVNAVEKTTVGFIEFSIDIIEKYDVCRVIFRIIDSGCGISIDKINEILSITGEFDQKDIENLEKSNFNLNLCQKIVKSLGGNLLLKSKQGKGTEVILTIDQTIFINNNENLLNKYSHALYDNKKVLVVCQNKEIFKIIKNKYNHNNISLTHLLYGMDAVDRIKSGKKYDYIIVEDNMKEMSGYTTLKELKKLNEFDIPVIVILDSSKEEIKEHYIEDGFKDYILLDNFSKELDKIINKY